MIAQLGLLPAIIVLSCGAAVLGISEIARLIGLDLRTEVAPVVTAGGVIGAVVLFALREHSERRRATLEAYEKQLYDKDLRVAISTVVTALDSRTYERDDEPAKVGSHRDQTTMILNYLEVSCEGVQCNLSDRRLFRLLMQPLARRLVHAFLLDVAAGDGERPTRKFLPKSHEFTAIRAVFPELF